MGAVCSVNSIVTSPDGGDDDLAGVDRARIVELEPDADADRFVFSDPLPAGLEHVMTPEQYESDQAALNDALAASAERCHGRRDAADGVAAVRAVVSDVIAPRVGLLGVRVDVIEEPATWLRPASFYIRLVLPAPDGTGGSGGGRAFRNPMQAAAAAAAAGRPPPPQQLQQRTLARPASLVDAVQFLQQQRTGGGRGGATRRRRRASRSRASSTASGRSGGGADADFSELSLTSLEDVPVPRMAPRRVRRQPGQQPDDGVVLAPSDSESDLSTQMDVREIPTSAKSWSLGFSPYVGGGAGPAFFIGSVGRGAGVGAPGSPAARPGIPFAVMQQFQQQPQSLGYARGSPSLRAAALASGSPSLASSGTRASPRMAPLSLDGGLLVQQHQHSQLQQQPFVVSIQQAAALQRSMMASSGGASGGGGGGSLSARPPRYGSPLPQWATIGPEPALHQQQPPSVMAVIRTNTRTGATPQMMGSVGAMYQQPSGYSGGGSGGSSSGGGVTVLSPGLSAVSARYAGGSGGYAPSSSIGSGGGGGGAVGASRAGVSSLPRTLGLRISGGTPGLTGSGGSGSALDALGAGDSSAPGSPTAATSAAGGMSPIALPPAGGWPNVAGNRLSGGRSGGAAGRAGRAYSGSDGSGGGVLFGSPLALGAVYARETSSGRGSTTGGSSDQQQAQGQQTASPPLVRQPSPLVLSAGDGFGSGAGGGGGSAVPAISLAPSAAAVFGAGAGAAARPASFGTTPRAGSGGGARAASSSSGSGGGGSGPIVFTLQLPPGAGMASGGGSGDGGTGLSPLPSLGGGGGGGSLGGVSAGGGVGYRLLPVIAEHPADADRASVASGHSGSAAGS